MRRLTNYKLFLLEKKINELNTDADIPSIKSNIDIPNLIDEVVDEVNKEGGITKKNKSTIKKLYDYLKSTKSIYLTMFISLLMTTLVSCGHVDNLEEAGEIAKSEIGVEEEIEEKETFDENGFKVHVVNLEKDLSLWRIGVDNNVPYEYILIASELKLNDIKDSVVIKIPKIDNFGNILHKVAKGETLHSLAKRYKLSEVLDITSDGVEYLKAINKIIHEITIGDVIKIPTKKDDGLSSGEENYFKFGVPDNVDVEHFNGLKSSKKKVEYIKNLKLWSIVQKNIKSSSKKNLESLYKNEVLIDGDGDLPGSYGKPHPIGYSADIDIRNHPKFGEDFKRIVNKLFELSKDEPIGIKIFCMSIIFHEGGYKKGSKAYNTRNPGNIGNTDDGKKRVFETEEDGIKYLIKYVKDIANGKNANYKIGSDRHNATRPAFSEELFIKWVNNIDSSMKPGDIWFAEYPVTPKFNFTYEGKLNQFTKLYSTASRQHNGYINTYLSFYKMFGFDINPNDKIQDLISLKAVKDPIRISDVFKKN